MPFAGALRTEFLADGRRMRVLEDVVYTDAAGRAWIVAAGFVTDGASIPDVLWGIVGSPFTGKYRVAAVFHDAAYQRLGVAKADADRMLREAALELGCEHWLAEAIYDGVRFGGLDAYAEDQRLAGLPSPTAG